LFLSCLPLQGPDADSATRRRYLRSMRRSRRSLCEALHDILCVAGEPWFEPSQSEAQALEQFGPARHRLNHLLDRFLKHRKAYRVLGSPLVRELWPERFERSHGPIRVRKRCQEVGVLAIQRTNAQSSPHRSTKTVCDLRAFVPGPGAIR